MAEEMGGFDAVLIPGSKYDAHGDNEWIWKLIERMRNACLLEFGCGKGKIADRKQRFGRSNHIPAFLAFVLVTKFSLVLSDQQLNPLLVENGNIHPLKSSSVL